MPSNSVSRRPSRKGRRGLRELNRAFGKEINGERINLLPLILRLQTKHAANPALSKQYSELISSIRKLENNEQNSRGFVARKSRPRDMSARPWNRGDARARPKRHKAR